jgi:hypothetical protein
LYWVVDGQLHARVEGFADGISTFDQLVGGWVMMMMVMVMMTMIMMMMMMMMMMLSVAGGGA